MGFEISAVFKRSITIERKNKERFETKKPCIVYIDGKLFCKTCRNVITIDGLEPGHEYGISLKEETGEESETVFRTAMESALLDVKRFNAAGDGKHNDTAALQAAIMSCPDNGTVYLPAGIYYTGPLFLKSHMNLWLDEGAVILGDTDRDHYPVLPGMIRDLYDNSREYNIASWEGNPLDSFASLITAVNCEDISITGRGCIDGNAQAGDWWVDPKKKRIAWRPKLVDFSHCRNIRMQGLTLKNSACWCVHPYYSNELVFLDLTIQNPSDSPNTDGFDPESCSRVRFLGGLISVGDDCIAIKSGKLYMAKYHHKESEDIVIRNCRLESGHGSVTIGSEVAGGVRNVKVSQCIFAGTDRGVRIKTRRGRGERSVITGLYFEDITMEKVFMPVTLNMFYYCDPDGHAEYVQSRECAPVDYRTPHIGRISLKNIECHGTDASFVCAYGLPEAPVEELTLSDIVVDYLPESERIPRCPVMMDNFTKLSGRSFYLVNIRHFSAKNIRIIDSADEHPYLENVENADMENVIYE